jgi:tRNA pseudouridine55 synthase
VNGILIIDKPQDFTSFDVVAVMRRLCSQKKIGHTGTLDPMATGVLPLLLGNAARAQAILPDSDKEYDASFQLGVTTDTLDSTGRVLTRTENVSVTRETLCRALGPFRGEIMQIPPMYSAVSKDGKRLYELARKGIEVEREKRPVTISELTLLSYNEETACGRLHIACSKGTYVRSLIDDIGRSLQCGGIMTELRRTKACGFTLDDALSLDEMKELAGTGRIEGLLRPTESLFMEYREIKVTAAQSVRFQNGGALDLCRTALKDGSLENEILRVKAPDGRFLGLGTTDMEKQALAVYKLF